MPEILALPGVLPATAPIPKRDSLRPYQRHAVTAWRSDLETKRAALGVMFTGAGKTRTAGTFIHEWQHGRVLWLAMRDFLLDQAASALGNITGEWIGREQASVSSNGERIVVGSVQSLHKKRLALHPRDEFSLIAFDEAHHAVAPGPRAIFDHFGEAKIIGLTATPYRLDKIGLDNVFGETPSFTYDIEFGTSEGYFCPVVPIKRPIESIDLSNVKKQAGDFQLTQLEEQIVNATAPIADISWEESEKGVLPAIVFTPGVASAHAVCKAINEKAGKEVAACIDAETPEYRRKEILSQFGTSVRIVVNCQVLTEGLDVPLARCIVIARLTASLSLYIQMAGRGGRPAAGIGELETKEERIDAIAASQKPWFKLVDITGKAGKHSLIGAVDALSGKAVTDVIRRDVERILEQSPGIKLDEATKLAKAEAAKKEAEEIRASEERIAKAAAVAEVRSKRESFDAFAKLGAEDLGDDGIPPEWLSSLPTADQLLWLRENKLSEEGVTRGQCAKLQKQAREWRKRGLASFKQRKVLERNKLPVDIPSAVAQRVIGKLIENNWNSKRARGAIDRIISEGRTVGEEG